MPKTLNPVPARAAVVVPISGEKRNAKNSIEDPMQALLNYLAWVDTRLVPLGVIQMYAGANPPSGWLPCDGRLLTRADFPDLFNTIGTTYGAGDGVTTFALPDLRGRFPLGDGTGPNLTARQRGNTGGTETHLLSIAELPAHAHTQRHSGVGQATTQISAAGGSLAETLTDPSIRTASEGGGQAHNNMPPYTVLGFIIRAVV